MSGMDPNKPIVTDNEGDAWLDKLKLTTIEKIEELIEGVRGEINNIFNFTAVAECDHTTSSNKECFGGYKFGIITENLANGQKKEYWTSAPGVRDDRDGFMTVFLYKLLKSLNVQKLEKTEDGFRVTYVNATSGEIVTETVDFPYEKMIKDESEFRTNEDERLDGLIGDETLARERADRNLNGLIGTVASSVSDHIGDTVKHITSQERATWNNKQDAIYTGDSLQLLKGNLGLTTGYVDFVSTIPRTTMFVDLPELINSYSYMLNYSSDKKEVTVIGFQSVCLQAKSNALNIQVAHGTRSSSGGKFIWYSKGNDGTSIWLPLITGE